MGVETTYGETTDGETSYVVKPPMLKSPVVKPPMVKPPRTKNYAARPQCPIFTEDDMHISAGNINH